MINNYDISNYPDLIRRCKAGEEEAFRCIFQHYYVPVKKNIIKFVADLHSAADILQDVFLTLWIKKHTLSDDTDIEAWLFSVSYYKSVSFLRKTVRSPVELPEEADIFGPYTNSAGEMTEMESVYSSQLHLLNEGIEQLSPQKKRAFILYKVKGKSYEEISQEMGLSELSVKQYVKTAMQFLKQYVRSHQLEISILSCLLLARYY